MTPARRNTAFASILALMMLVVLAALSTVYATTANMAVQQSNNSRSVHQALTAAENGMTAMLYWLRSANVTYGKTGSALMGDVTTALARQLDAQDVLQGQRVERVGDQLRIRDALLPDGSAFDAVLQTVSPTSSDLQLTVTGKAGAIARSIGVTLKVQQARSFVLDFGIASKSAIEMTGNASVRGANNAAEASILSATLTNDQAFKLTGNVVLQGDITASNPDAHVSMTGNVTVAGCGINSPQLQDHVHIGVDAGEFPEVDPTVFEPFATNMVDKNTPTNGNRTFKNIRIKSGTNPTFSGNTVLQGVIYIEKGNRVQFSGNTTITGVIVTEDAGDNAYDTNTIKFSGNLASRGVEQLPDNADFHQLRQMPGAFILAPGFGVEFVGNFGTVNGCMAADSYRFTGNAGGTVHGPVINYSDSTFTMVGNSTLVIDRVNAPAVPPGFKLPAGFSVDSSTYVEYGGE